MLLLSLVVVLVLVVLEVASPPPSLALVRNAAVSAPNEPSEKTFTRSMTSKDDDEEADKDKDEGVSMLTMDVSALGVG